MTGIPRTPPAARRVLAALLAAASLSLATGCQSLETALGTPKPEPMVPVEDQWPNMVPTIDSPHGPQTQTLLQEFEEVSVEKASVENELDNRTSEVKALRDDLARTTGRLETANATVDQLKNRVETLQTENAKLQQRIMALEIQRAREEAKSLALEIKDLENQLAYAQRNYSESVQGGGRDGSGLLGTGTSAGSPGYGGTPPHRRDH